MLKFSQRRARQISIAFYLVILVTVILLSVKLYTIYSHSLSKGRIEKSVSESMLERDGISQAILLKEMEDIYGKRLMFHPYRWYSLPEGYQGEYFSTDKFGFRTNGKSYPGTPRVKIGFFGGSTAFSVKTDDRRTIPALMEQNLFLQGVCVRNYGIGAYNLTNELITYMEVARREPLNIVIFYDGVNEIARYVEYIQDATTAPYYDTLGYACFEWLKEAVANLPGLALKKSTKDFAQRNKYLPREKGKNIDQAISDETADSFAEQLLSIYEQNVLDAHSLVRGRGGVPIFLWQPDIWSTRKSLTKEERAMQDYSPGVRRLGEAVHRKLPSLAERLSKKGILFIDISDSLDGLDAENHFYDFCHVDATANAVIAQRISNIVLTQLKKI